MAERRRERVRKKGDGVKAEPPRKETKKSKATKFIIDAGELLASPEDVEKVKSALLRSAVDQLKGFKAVSGDALRPNIGVEFFSLSFSLSFSLGF
jgi:hypothetical protein